MRNFGPEKALCCHRHETEATQTAGQRRGSSEDLGRILRRLGQHQWCTALPRPLLCPKNYLNQAH